MSEWKEYVGAISPEVDGRDYELISFAVDTDTGKKLVRTMNRFGRAMGFCRGVVTHEIQMTAAIPCDDDFDWADVDGAKITLTPVSGKGKPISYINCLTTKIGEKYDADNEARRDITVLAQRRIKE